MLAYILKIKQHYLICNTPLIWNSEISKYSSCWNSTFLISNYWIFYSVFCPHLIQIQKIIPVTFWNSMNLWPIWWEYVCCGNHPTLAADRSLSPQKLKTNTRVCLRALQENLQGWMEGGGEGGADTFPDKNHLEYDLFNLCEKNCYRPYSLLIVSIMSFLIICFSFRFYFTWWCRHIMKHFILQIIVSLK